MKDGEGIECCRDRGDMEEAEEVQDGDGGDQNLGIVVAAGEKRRSACQRGSLCTRGREASRNSLLIVSPCLSERDAEENRGDDDLDYLRPKEGGEAGKDELPALLASPLPALSSSSSLKDSRMVRVATRRWGELHPWSDLEPLAQRSADERRRERRRCW